MSKPDKRRGYPVFRQLDTYGKMPAPSAGVQDFLPFAYRFKQKLARKKY